MVGIVSVFSGVKATRQITTSGASTKATTRLWKTRAMGPFFCMARLTPESGGRAASTMRL